MILYIFLTVCLLFQADPPPGTIRIGDLYVDKTEILNIHWREYQHYASQQLDKSEHWKINPDSSNNWLYQTSRAFEPVTLITYEQANAYCKWRSNIVKNNLGIDVVYRLPTEKEWDLIAKTVIGKNEKKVIKSLHKLHKKIADREGEYFLEKRESPKNTLYDLFSNVSEMTSAKGIAKGGSNDQLLEYENLDQSIEYNEPNQYLGFRCVAEIRE